MKVKYYLDHVDSKLIYPSAKSDLNCLDIDCIGLVLSNTIDLIGGLECELEKLTFDWWGVVGHVVGNDNEIRIYTPQSYNDEHALIERSQLKAIIRDWKKFIETKKPMEQSY